MPYAWTGAFRTWYEADGPEDRPAVVFVHGHTFNRTMWAPQVAALRDRYRVVTYDLRGHGRSETPASGYWSAVYADDLLALLDGLGIERAALAGNSVGGSAVVHLALRHPERVAALALVGSAVGRPPESEEERAMHRRMWEITAARGIQPALEQAWLPGRLFEGARRRPEVMAMARRMCLDYGGQGFRDPYRPAQQERLYARLGELRCPVLVAYGDLDHVEVLATADEAAQLLPEAAFLRVAGAGHLVNLEEPALFTRALADFLARALATDA